MTQVLATMFELLLLPIFLFTFIVAVLIDMASAFLHFLWKHRKAVIILAAAVIYLCLIVKLTLWAIILISTSGVPERR